MAYCTLAELHSYLGIPDATTTDDTLLSRMTARAKAFMDADVGRTFEAPSDTTRKFDAIRDVTGRVLRLDHDLCAITSITNGDGTIVTSAQYVTEPRNEKPWYELRLLGSSGLAWNYTTDPENAISIVGKWAWSETPDDLINDIAVRLVAYMYRQKDNAGDLDRAVIAGNATILPAAIPSDLLYKFRLRRRRTT